MMRTSIAAIALSLGLALPLSAQSAEVPWTYSYDMVKDSTRFEFFGLHARRADDRGPNAADPDDLWGRLGFSPRYKTPGRSTALPDSIDILVSATGPAIPGEPIIWQFNRDRSLTLLLDSTARLRSTAYRRDTMVVMGYSIESLTFRIPRASYKRLLAAHSVQGVLGENTGFTIDPAELDRLRQPAVAAHAPVSR